MNMVGNLGAALSAIAFPYFVANVTIPVIAEQSGTASSFFVFAAGMNILAVIAWTVMNPARPLKEIEPAALKQRIILFAGMIVLVISALVYTKFLLPKAADDKPAQDRAAAQLQEDAP